MTNSLSSSFWFDEEAADRAVQFFSVYLRHTKGRWAGSSFQLSDWQRDDIIRPIFGWKRRDGTRRYRTAYIEIPRKNGKSTLAAGIALYLLFADGEMGAEIFGVAADRDQAAIVHDQAKGMVESSKSLHGRSTIYKRAIVVPKTRSSYKVISAEAYTKHGLNAHGIVFDELHAQPNRELWDVLTTSTGSRMQPLVVAITTAGYDRQSICYEQHEHAREILDGVIEDDSYFAYIAAADQSDDWTSPKTWRKANPGLGSTIFNEYMEAECRRAQQVPAYQNTFRRLHLNQWTSQDTRWLDLGAWDACGGEAIEPADLAGRPCYAGLDLASTTDVAALVLVFPPQEDGKFYVLPYFWIPAENITERGLRDRVPYDAWVRDGLMYATEGNVIDLQAIRAMINGLAEQYKIREVAFDRWGATAVSQDLIGDGFEMVQFGQGFASMSAPTKELLRLVLAKKLQHGNHPILRWMADNLVVDTDAAANLKPNKAKSREKIDGMVAMIMGLDRALRNGGAQDSVYEERGVITL